MLNESKVLSYIKTKLASPFIPLELDDNQILNIVRLQTIPLFSRYLPDLAETTIDPQDNKYQTNVDNEYKILDDREILNIVKVYTDSGVFIIAGHPVIGSFGGDYDQVIDYLLKVDKAGANMPINALKVIAMFKKPNIIRLIPNYKNKFKVVYERYHADDFSTIPSEFQMHFLELAYAHVAKQIGKIRRQFRVIQTPFGEVELNADALIDEADRIEEKIIEELKDYNPPILLDIG